MREEGGEGVGIRFNQFYRVCVCVCVCVWHQPHPNWSDWVHPAGAGSKLSILCEAYLVAENTKIKLVNNA